MLVPEQIRQPYNWLVSTGGGRELCPDAMVDDGLLDVSYVVNPSIDQIPSIMGNLLDGSSSISDMKEIFGNLRCEWLEIDCSDELQVRGLTPD
jgi:diacylglycerol kinase family enzyme